MSWTTILAFAVIVQIADVWSTIVALRIRAGQESNPIVLWMMKHFGPAGWPVVKLIWAGGLLVLLWALDTRRAAVQAWSLLERPWLSWLRSALDPTTWWVSAQIAAISVTLLMAAVVAQNLRFIQRA